LKATEKTSHPAQTLMPKGIIALNETDGKYHFGAFNDGHYADSQANLGLSSLQWGFAVRGSTFALLSRRLLAATGLRLVNLDRRHFLA